MSTRGPGSTAFDGPFSARGMTYPGLMRGQMTPGYGRSVQAPGPLPVVPRRLSRGGLIAVDGLAAAGYATLLLVAALTEVRPAEPGVPLWAECLVVALTGFPIAIRRPLPLTALGIALVLAVASVLLDMVRDPFVVVCLTLYTVAVTDPARRWIPWLAASMLGLAGALGTPLTTTPYWWLDGPGLILFGWAAMAGSWTVGRAVKERRAAIAHFTEQVAERAAAEERLRIARELHDIVTHSMGLIAVKSAVANHVARTRPEEVQDALRVIEATSRSTLREMRQMLGVLRSEVEPGPLGPAPGLARLPELAARAGTAGVTVEMELRTEDTLPEGLELSVYRIAQEALTNVIKHAAPASCRILVTADGRTVTIEVSDDGGGGRHPQGHPPARPGPGSGRHGLLGMRERAALYGGSFTAGPSPDGGFRVRAQLPYQPVVKSGEGV